MTRELDAAVAEAMGWTDVRWEEDPMMIAGGVLKGYNPKSTYAWCLVPYYRTDIAAARELEDWIEPRPERIKYAFALKEIVVWDIKDGCNIDMEWSSYMREMYWRLAHATPEQRCRAFLKAMGEEVADGTTTNT